MQAYTLLQHIQQLPWFLVDAVYEYAGKATAYEHGRLERPLTEREMRAVVGDAFRLNMLGLAQKLRGGVVVGVELLYVMTTEMEEVSRAFAVEGVRVTGIDLERDEVGKGVLGGLMGFVERVCIAGDDDEKEEGRQLVGHVWGILDRRSKRLPDTHDAVSDLSASAAGVGLVDCVKARTRAVGYCAGLSGSEKMVKYVMGTATATNTTTANVEGSGGSDNSNSSALDNNTTFSNNSTTPNTATNDDSANTADESSNGTSGNNASSTFAATNTITTEAPDSTATFNTTVYQVQPSVETITTTTNTTTTSATNNSHLARALTFGAIDAGHVHLLPNLIQPLRFDALRIALRSSNSPILTRIVNNTLPIDADALDLLPSALAAHGHLALLKSFLSSHPSTSLPSDTIDDVAENGHLDVVTYLHEHSLAGATSHAIDAAAENGHLAVVNYLLSNRSEGCSARALIRAANNGHYEIYCALAAAYPALVPSRLDISPPPVMDSLFVCK